MKRRQFMQSVAGATLAGGLLTTTQAATLPHIKWRLSSSFPKNLSILHEAPLKFSERIAQLSQGQFEIQVFSAGEIVSGTQVLDAVQQGTVEMGYSPSYYYHGKNKAFSIDTTLPFGMTARMKNAWLYAGGGLEVLRELFAKYNIINFPGGNTGTQMGGWFRREIKTLEDLKGLKFRIPGFGAEILARLGVIPQNIPASDIYSALEKGTIDATEFTGPYDDLQLGLQRVAPFYYAPGFWEGSANISFYIHDQHWKALPAIYQEMISTVTAEINFNVLAQYDAHSPQALASLIKNGALLRTFPKTVLEAAYEQSQIIYAEEAKKNPDFKRIFEHWQAFHHQSYQWFRVNEGIFQNFMFQQTGRRQ